MMAETPKKPEIDKWGGVLSFGRGRKRLIIALCALLLMIGAFCIAFVIKWGKTDEGEKIIGAIDGGVEAHSLPWQVGILFEKQGPIHCGGSLITCQHVLTAAHCIENPYNGTIFDTNGFYVVVGEHNISSDADGKYVRVKEIHRHERWDVVTVDYDFAILTLQEPLQLDEKIQTISLPRRKDENYSGKACKASGWGDLEFCKEKPCKRPDVLQQVVTQCISNKDCSNTVGYKKFARKNARRVITENMICAGNMLYGGEDACQGDSGGPLTTIDDDGNPILIGVSSWGYGCGQSEAPGVYAKVAAVLTWINRITYKDNLHCEACEDMKKCSQTKLTYELCQTNRDIEKSCPKSCCAQSSLEDFCKVNVKYGNWTNNGSCQPSTAEIECGKKIIGIQHQSRSCKNGTYYKCLTSKTNRNVSCEINSANFSQCQESTNSATTKTTFKINVLLATMIYVMIL